MLFKPRGCVTCLSISCSGDRLRGAVIRVGSNVTPQQNTACGVPVSALEAMRRGGTIVRTCTGGLIGRFLSVDIPARRFLTLCEVKILETCEGELTARQ